MLGVVASASAASEEPGSLNFLLVVPKGDAKGLMAVARCAALEAPLVRVMDFELGDWPTNATKQISRHTRLSDPLNYARFFIGDLFFPDEELVVYLDSDVVVRRDLKHLVTEAENALKNTDAVVAVAPRDFKRVCGHVVDCDKAATLANTSTSLMEGRLHAFNAGVVVVNVSMWKRRKMTSKVAHWIVLNHDHHLYDLGSNPPLVLAVADNWVRLDAKWNCMRGLRRQHAHNTACWDTAYLRHFPGDDKPWLSPKHNDGWDVPDHLETCLSIL